MLFACYAYFATHMLYTIAFEFTTWISETVFNVIGMSLWSIVFKMASRHRVLRMLVGQTLSNNDPEDESPKGDNESPKEDNESIILEDKNITMTSKQVREMHIASQLPKTMEEKKLYLNPKLSIVDIAVALGTNKTYLSDYLNNTLKVTFNDFVNQYRVKEACRIIDNMSVDDKRTMVEVATMSGFNSSSSCNRYFIKLQGTSPRQYFIGNSK